MAENQQKLVNNILYLASLVSDVRRVDSWLDSLRSVTARHDATAPLGAQDERALLDLQSRLKDYLVKQDPLRRFKPEVLDQKMYENLQGHQHYNRLRTTIGLIIGFAVGVSVATFAVTQLTGQTTIPQMPYLVGFGSLCLGAVFLLVQAARTFNRQLRQVYVSLGLAVAFTAILLIQFSFFAVLKGSWWMEAWAFSVLHAAIGVVLYLAFRKLAQQLNVMSVFVSKKGIAAVVAATVVVCLFLPHTTTSLPEPVYDVSVINIGLLIVFSAVSLVLGRAVVDKVSALYTKAIWCLMAAVGTMAAVGAIVLVTRLAWLQTGQAPLFMSVGTMVLSVIGGSLFLYATYVFNKTSRY